MGIKYHSYSWSRFIAGVLSTTLAMSLMTGGSVVYASTVTDNTEKTEIGTVDTTLVLDPMIANQITSVDKQRKQELHNIFKGDNTEQKFKDIDNAKINALCNAGIISGDGNGNYLPNDNITLGQLAIMLLNTWEPGVTRKTFESVNMTWNKKLDNLVKYCWIQGWFCNSTSNDINKPVTIGTLLESMYKACDIGYYGDKLYPGGAIVTFAKIDGGFSYSKTVEILQHAQRVGIYNGNKGALDTVNREEAAEILYNCIEFTQNDNKPDIFYAINIDYNSAYKLGEHLSELVKVPEQVIKSFSDNGWTLELTGETLDKFNTDTHMTASGLTSYGKKVISMGEVSSLVHEFGHYVCLASGAENTAILCYNTELEQGSKVLGEYSRKNPDEYFAEAFNYYIQFRNDFEYMNKLKECAPMTYEMMATLEYNGWV